MATATETYAVDRIDDAVGYEPLIIAGTQVGENHQIEPRGYGESRLDVALWRSGPGTYDYLFEGDEAFHVVEGTATVTLTGSGETIELQTRTPRAAPKRGGFDPDGNAWFGGAGGYLVKYDIKTKQLVEYPPPTENSPVGCSSRSTLITIRSGAEPGSLLNFTFLK